ncbi:MAG: TVP38/TMEM64 family protein [Oscillospiraceae bacterium]|nr:TVP38/TMEM64 family protein [Oscillospiraceae bacterium]
MPESKQQPNIARWRWLIVAAVILFATALAWFVGRPLLRFAAEPEKFRAWVSSHGAGGALAYVAMVAFQIVVAIIPGEPFELAAGYAFGAVRGTALSLVAATIGSLIVFAITRRWGMRVAELFFDKEKLRSLRFLKTTPQRTLLFLIIFMLPGTPKDLLCYYAGLTDIELLPWLLICSLGRLPSILTSTVGGDALGDQNYAQAAIVFAVTLAISAGGLLLYNWICKKKASD